MVRSNEAVAEMLAALNNERDKSKMLAARVAELEAENARLREALANIGVMGYSDDPQVAANIAKYAVDMAREARALAGQPPV